MEQCMVTVICPIYNEEKFIDRFIHSILSQDYPNDKMDVMLIDGMSSDSTREIINRYVIDNSCLHLVDNPQKTVPFALNKGITMAKGDVIIRLDAHCTYPENYVSRLVEELFRLDADNVGGVWNTLPAKDTSECLSIAIASSHPFGVGASAHKVGADTIRKVDTVPFGCYRKSVFDKIGMFDEELVRNQDDEFNARLIKNGGSIYIIPDIVIDYTARDSIKKMRRMYYQYGLFKPLVNKKLGSPATVRQFFPALFIVGLVLGFILSLLSKLISVLYIIILFLYVIIGVYVGIKKAKEYERPALVAYMPYTFFNIHLSYGWGYLKGIYKLFTHKKINVQTNR